VAAPALHKLDLRLAADRIDGVTWRGEPEQEQVERVLTSYEAGSFLIDRLGAGLVIDRDLAVVLLDLRCPLFRGKVSDPPGSRARYIEADHERAVRSSP